MGGLFDKTKGKIKQAIAGLTGNEGLKRDETKGQGQQKIELRTNEPGPMRAAQSLHEGGTTSASTPR